MAKPYDMHFAVQSEPQNETYLNDNSTREYRFSNLLPSTQYEMKAFAHNVGGGKGLGSVVTRYTDMISVNGMRKRGIL